MNNSPDSISACRYCRYYSPQGRRGGTCQQLGVPVQACWKACSLAVSPFASDWQDLEKILSISDVDIQPVASAYPAVSR
jgi:hypothetical protein